MDYSCFDGRTLYIKMLTRLQRSTYVMNEIQGIVTLGSRRLGAPWDWKREAPERTDGRLDV